MDRLRKDLFAAGWRSLSEHSNSVALFFLGVAVSLICDVIVIRSVTIFVAVKVVTVVTVKVFMPPVALRAVVEASRSAASRLSDEAFKILSKYATKTFLASISKPLAGIIKLIIKIRKALNEDANDKRHGDPDDVTRLQVSGYMVFVTGFVAGGVVHPSLLFIQFARQTDLYSSACKFLAFLIDLLVSNFVIFPVLYYLLISLLSLIVMVVFVIFY